MAEPIVGELSKDLQWVDVSERLGLAHTQLRYIRNRFGPVLGLSTPNKVPESMLGAISFIAAAMERGVPDDEIEKRLKEAKTHGWPEDVLMRMESLEAATATDLILPESDPREPDRVGKPSPRDGIPLEFPARGNSKARDEIFPEEICGKLRYYPEMPETVDCEVHPVQTGGLVQEQYQVTPESALPCSSGPSAQIPPETVVVPQGSGKDASVREMVLDLRREICTYAVSQREEIQRLQQVVRKLTQEVRELRYALILSSSRKDRKRRCNGLSRLLSG
ncbi:MAG TPA: hypothetical protein GXX30_04360 [Firmicutes bacterium]|nr:hypothetical protein [Candidatus Fermentithermobacillaceae bacterium]